MVTMLAPLIACAVFVAVPAKLNTFFLYSAGDEWAAYRHPRFAFTSHAAAGGICLIIGTEDTGEAAYSYGWMVDIHEVKLYSSGVIWANIGGLMGWSAA